MTYDERLADWAGMAMQGLLANTSALRPKEIALCAWQVADAMMEEKLRRVNQRFSIGTECGDTGEPSESGAV